MLANYAKYANKKMLALHSKRYFLVYV